MNRFHFSLRNYMLWLTLLPLLVMAVSFATFFLRHQFIVMDEELLARGQLMARQLAASSEYAVFSSNRSVLNELAQNALQEKDMVVVQVRSLNETLVLVGKTKIAGVALPSTIDSGVAQQNDGQTLWLSQPILSAQLALDEPRIVTAPQQVGSVLIALSWQRIQQQKTNLLLTTFFVTTVFLCLTLWLVFRASRRVIQPIHQLRDAIAAIGAGKLDTRVSASGCVYELCGLSEGVNHMAAELLDDRNLLQQRIDEATAQLRNLAFYDPLTLLPNRRLLSDRLSHAFASSKRTECYGAVMFLDLDNFKPLNDQYGHGVGDLLLIEVAHRISRCLREMDSVARFGGDEFVVMLGELSVNRTESQALAHRVAEKIRVSLTETYRLVDSQPAQAERVIEHHCTASIGVTLFQNHEASQEEVLGQADAAMYQAKAQGRNQICFYRDAAEKK